MVRRQIRDPLMIRPAAYFVQLFRQAPNDVGRLETPLFAADITDAIAKSKPYLLSHFNDGTVDPSMRPHHARILDHTGRTLVELMAVDAVTVEIALKDDHARP